MKNFSAEDETSSKPCKNKEPRKRKNQPQNPAGFDGRTPEQDRAALRRKVKMFYDLQMLRMRSQGRVTNKAFGNPIQLHPGDIQILSNRADDLHRAETNALADVEDHLKTMPFYLGILSDKEKFRGIGPTMAGVILSEFDITRADTVSAFWKYAGLAPIPASRCKICQGLLKTSQDKFEHVAQNITCSERGRVLGPSETFASGATMRPVKGEKLPYNAFLKTKLIGVLGPVLLKTNSPWKKYYDEYKQRMRSAGKGMSDLHRHNAAVRYMIKMLLQTIWLCWRYFEKLPTREPYHQAKQKSIETL